MFGNMKLFLRLNRISHSFALHTREISWSTLKLSEKFTERNARNLGIFLLSTHVTLVTPL